MAFSEETLGAAIALMNASLAGAGSLKGEKGDQGPKGDPGEKGETGASAYDVALENGFEGSEEDWLKSLTPTNIATVSESPFESHPGTFKLNEIGGKCEQNSTTGKQLLDFGNIISANSTVNVNNDILTVSGTSAYSLARFIVNNPTAHAGQNLTLSCETWSKSNANASVSFQAVVADADGNVKYHDGTANKTFEIPGNVSSITVNIYANNSATALDTANTTTIKGLTLNVGSTVLPWEPYTGGIPSPSPNYPQEIKKTVVSEIKTHGKNFVKNKLTSGTRNGITYAKNSDGSIVLNGTASATMEFDVSNFVVDKDSAYILSGCPSGGSGSTYSLRYYEWDKSWKQLTRNDNYGEGVVLNHSNSAVNIATRIVVVSGVTVSNLTFYPMIREVGTDATYEPYTESTIKLSKPIELYGIGDVQDTIDVEKGVVERNIGNFHVSGDWEWNKHGAGAGNAYYARRSSLNPKVMADGTNGIFTHFGTGNLITNNKAFVGNIGGTNVQLRHDDLVSISALKTWLNENEVYASYILAEPVIEELPTADQTALNNLSTFDNMTYVEFDSEIEPTFSGETALTPEGSYVLDGLAKSKILTIECLDATAYICDNLP